MAPGDLRIALVTGNYNYVRDGANQALNRLVGFLLRQGAQVRVYAPIVDKPAFEPVGEMVGLKSVSIPRRREYRIPTGLGPEVRADLAAFQPNLVHISSPDNDLLSESTTSKNNARPAHAEFTSSTSFATDTVNSL